MSTWKAAAVPATFPSLQITVESSYQIFTCAWGKMASFPCTLTIYRRYWLRGTHDPRYRLLHKTHGRSTEASLFSLHWLLGSWVFLNHAHSGWYVLHITPGSVLCLGAALLLTIFDLLHGMLSWQRSFGNCFPQSLRQSNMETGGEGFLSSLHVKILIKGLVPCCQARMAIFLHFSIC